MDEIRKHQIDLLEIGFKEAYIPKGFGNEKTDDRKLKDLLSKEEDSKRKIEYDLIRRHFNLIIQSDCVLVANHKKKSIGGYIGGNTFLEMGYAYILGKPIFILNPLPDLPYITEMEGMQPIILYGDLQKIKNYYHF